jgi:hypothetical protein
MHFDCKHIGDKNLTTQTVEVEVFENIVHDAVFGDTTHSASSRTRTGNVRSPIAPFVLLVYVIKVDKSNVFLVVGYNPISGFVVAKDCLEPPFMLLQCNQMVGVHVSGYFRRITPP